MEVHLQSPTAQKANECPTRNGLDLCGWILASVAEVAWRRIRGMPSDPVRCLEGAWVSNRSRRSHQHRKAW